MPEFIMPLDDGDYAEQWQSATIGEFAKGYFEAMFFTECHSDNPELEDATIDDMSAESWEQSLEDCADFQRENSALLELAYNHESANYDEQRAGNDYWYTRNGHGTGFWDRGLGKIGDDLAKACRNDSRDLYIGDDGKLYLS